MQQRSLSCWMPTGDIEVHGKYQCIHLTLYLVRFVVAHGRTQWPKCPFPHKLSPALLGSVREFPPGGSCPQHLQKEAAKGYRCLMPKPPHQAPFSETSHSAIKPKWCLNSRSLMINTQRYFFPRDDHSFNLQKAVIPLKCYPT